jgi:DNA replication protein DnaC
MIVKDIGKESLYVCFYHPLRPACHYRSTRVLLLSIRLPILRYQSGAILITSNKTIREWPDMLAGDEVIAAAILDRILHASHVLHIAGRSYRLRDLESAMRSRT